MFQKAAVIGAGTMGRGIGQLMAQTGIKVILCDENPIALTEAMESIRLNCQKSLQRGKISKEKMDATLSLITPQSDLSYLEDVELMIEAVVENLELKKSIFAQADQILNPKAVMATNTSSLPVTEIASSTNRPKQVLGLHFFNPPTIMKLLEIILTPQTSMETLLLAQAFAHHIQKEAIVVHDSPGFATSRLGICLALESMRMLEQKVASIKDLDNAMALGYGHPMGPLMLTDWVGLDVRLSISEHLFHTLGSPIFSPPKILMRMVRHGLLGKKIGEGFYVWQDQKPLGVSEQVLQLL